MALCPEYTAHGHSGDHNCTKKIEHDGPHRCECGRFWTDLTPTQARDLQRVGGR